MTGPGSDEAGILFYLKEIVATGIWYLKELMNNYPTPVYLSP